MVADSAASPGLHRSGTPPGRRTTSVSVVVLLASVGSGTLLPEVWRVVLATVLVTGGAVLLGPVVLLQFMLGTAGIRLDALTGGERGLLPALGGMSADGFRLATVVIVGAALCVLSRPILAALGKRVPYLAFLAFAGVSLAWTSSRMAGMRVLAMLVFPMVGYALAMATCATRGDRHIRSGVVAGALVASAVGVIVGIVSGEWGSEEWLRYPGSLGPATFGLFCSVTALPVYGWARDRKSGWLYSLFALLVVQILASGTRIAIVALGAGLIVLELARRNLWRPLLVGGTVALLWVTVPALGERTGQLPDPSAEGLRSLNASGRWVLWEEVWDSMVTQMPIWGNGLGSSSDFLLERRGGGVVDSEYLRVFAELGPVGLAMFILAYGEIVFSVIGYLRAGGPRRSEAHIALAGVVAFSVVSVTTNTLNSYAFYSLVTWVLVGAALAPVADIEVSEAHPRNYEKAESGT